MNKRWLLPLGILLIAMVALVWWITYSLREPTYKGQRLGLWLKGYPSDESYTSAAPTEQIDEAVRQMGTNCLPILLRGLRANAPGWTAGLPLLGRYYRFVEARRAQALKGFQALGPEANGAVPALIEIYQQNISAPSACAAARALGAIGSSASNAVPSLVQGATNADPAVRVVAVSALGELRCEPDRVVPVLISSLKDPDQEVRHFAAFWLWAGYANDARPAIPALLEKLKDPYYQVRGDAASALGAAHAQSELVVPALITALEDPNPFVRSRAAAGLKSFGADAGPARDALIHLLRDNDQGVKDNAAQALRAIDSEAAAGNGLK
jgi:vesicle coat complex subunit